MRPGLSLPLAFVLCHLTAPDELDSVLTRRCQQCSGFSAACRDESLRPQRGFGG